MKSPSNLALDPRYRLGVGIMLLNPQNLVFVGQRVDNGAWQMPQGGIDDGEGPYEAALRELEEEAGTNQVTLLTESKEWIKYDLPPDLVPKFWGGKYIGQQQKWFLCRIIDEEAINVKTDKPEFNSWKWVHPEETLKLIVDFKLELYKKVLKEFSPHL
jgi:putative (di)nucleoside polyphosphate hydrolase